MIKSLLKPVVITLVAISLAGVALPAQAQDKTNAPTAPVKHTKIPFSGTLSAVDKTALTITVKKTTSEKTYEITATTKFVKDGKPATLDDAKVGEEVAGSYKKTAGGKLQALSVRFGPKPETTGGEHKKKKKTEEPAGTNAPAAPMAN